jgi:hypothetical protein
MYYCVIQWGCFQCFVRKPKIDATVESQVSKSARPGAHQAIFLGLGGPFLKRLGPGAVGAFNRIFGFLILAIAVRLVWDGVAHLKG